MEDGRASVKSTSTAAVMIPGWRRTALWGSNPRGGVYREAVRRGAVLVRLELVSQTVVQSSRGDSLEERAEAAGQRHMAGRSEGVA